MISDKLIYKLIEILVHHLNDLRSIRIIMIWLYSVSYLFLSFYCVIKYESVASVVITSNATLVGVIFSGYIFSKIKWRNNNENSSTNNTNN